MNVPEFLSWADAQESGRYELVGGEIVAMVPERLEHVNAKLLAVDALRACVSDAADDPTISPVASKRLKEMLAFTELVDRWYMQMLNVPRPRLVAMIKLGEKIVSFLPVGKAK